jgi:urease accessory protein
VTTRIVVEAGAERQRLHLQPGLLRGQVTANTAEGCRIGLVTTTALLLGGDTVQLDVEVGPGAALDLFDVAGTVAYHGRGQPAAWLTALVVAEGGRLHYRGEPFVVADGADVTRRLQVDLAGGGARCRLRETVILGRSGERGGRLHTRTEACRGGRSVWLEEQVWDGDRTLPGILGPHRVVDTLIDLGPGPPPIVPGMVAYALPDDAGTVLRHLGSELAESPLSSVGAQAWIRSSSRVFRPSEI